MVIQATIGSTICIQGWTQTVRPSQQYTSALKRQRIIEFGYTDRKLGDDEEDHLIPLGLGGAPYDARNLWLNLGYRRTAGGRTGRTNWKRSWRGWFCRADSSGRCPADDCD
jgi:hypothetical protein